MNGRTALLGALLTLGASDAVAKYDDVANTSNTSNTSPATQSVEIPAEQSAENSEITIDMREAQKACAEAMAKPKNRTCTYQDPASGDSIKFVRAFQGIRTPDYGTEYLVQTEISDGDRQTSPQNGAAVVWVGISFAVRVSRPEFAANAQRVAVRPPEWATDGMYPNGAHASVTPITCEDGKSEGYTTWFLTSERSGAEDTPVLVTDSNGDMAHIKLDGLNPENTCRKLGRRVE